MTLMDGLVLMIGIASILIGCMSKTFYYIKGRTRSSDEPAPTWIGRSIFIGVGLLFVVMGLRHLFFSE